MAVSWNQLYNPYEIHVLQHARGASRSRTGHLTPARRMLYQLSYGPIERNEKGRSPLPVADQYGNSLYLLLLVGEEGFEPPVSCSQSRRPDQAGLHPDLVLAAIICSRTLLSTVELTINVSPVPRRLAHGRKDSNPRELLWRQPCLPLHHTRMKLYTEKPP
jgi:hypothetical protein